MMSVLGSVRRTLGEHAAAAGFYMVDESTGDAGSNVGISQLEYRAQRENGPLLLGLFDVNSLQTVTAEMWSPGDLAGGLAGGVDTVAIRRQTWRYNSPADFERLAPEIASVVSEWVLQSCSAVMIHA
jgi:hypothetical protein